MSLRERLNSALAGRYTIEREIGAGGMATVFLAHDVKHNRRVALKVLRPELAAVLGARRFLSEIEVTANLQHPHILPLFDSGEADGLLYYVMPYVEGETLRQRLERERQLPIEDAVQIAIAIAHALDHAHRNGIIHRDLKPENILLHDGNPIVADFGIALAVSNLARDRITETGISMGTPQYMSPEQISADVPVDARSDVYALGVVLYEMLVGEPPFLGMSAQSVMAKVLHEPLRPPQALRSSVPQPVDLVVVRALARVPADRIETAGDFARALNASLMATVDRGVISVRLVRARWLALGVLATVAALTTFIFMLQRRPDQGAPPLANAPRVGVLPFEDHGPPGPNYIAEGIAAEVSNRLAALMPVIGPRRLREYRTAALQKLISDYDVSHVLDGSVHRGESGLIRVHIQLVNAMNGVTILTRSFDGQLRDELALESAIADTIVNALKLAGLLTASAQLDAEQRNSQLTRNQNARDLYQRAMQADRRQRDALLQATVLLEQALQFDPNFHEARAQLAQAYVNRSYWHGDKQIWADSGVRLARRVLNDAPKLALAHFAVGSTELEFGRLDEAFRSYDRARKLEPGNSDAILHLGWIDLLRGNLLEAARQLHQARSLDRQTALIALDLGQLYRMLGDDSTGERWRDIGISLDRGNAIPGLRRGVQFDDPTEACRQTEKALLDRPGQFAALDVAARAALRCGEFARAAQHLEQMHRVNPQDWAYRGETHRTLYGYALHKQGERVRADSVLRDVIADGQRRIGQGDQRPGVPREIAAAYAVLGNRNEALRWYRRAVNTGWRMERLAPSPLFESIKDDPDFRALNERVARELARVLEQVRKEIPQTSPG